jgi:hypothetical protein
LRDRSATKDLSFARHSQNSFCEKAFLIKGEVQANEHDLDGKPSGEVIERFKLKSLIMAQIERWRQA